MDLFYITSSIHFAYKCCNTVLCTVLLCVYKQKGKEEIDTFGNKTLKVG